MNDYEMIINSEFGNVLALAGIDENEFNSLIDGVKKLSPAKRLKAAKKLTNSIPITLQRGSRYEMEIRFGQLPDEIKTGLLKKRLQLVDRRFYVVKEITSKQSVDVFMGTDQKAIGLANIANSKLEKDNWFLVCGIKAAYGIAATKEAADFGIIPPVVRNGEFEFTAGAKVIMPPTDGEIFNSTNRSNIEIGSYKLENAKMIEPQVEIKMPFKFAAALPATVCWLKVTLIGASVDPY